MSLAVVTGANMGIGFATVLGLLRAGHDVVMTARNVARGEAALEAARHQTGAGERVTLHMLDLGTLQGVRASAAALRHKHDTIDLLVNNAGIMWPRRRLTEDGFEEMLGVNHLGHYLWTRLLLDRVPAGGRVVAVSSSAHWFSRGVRFDDPHWAGRHFQWWQAYADSKLAIAQFIAELARRRPDLWTGAVDPGPASTDVVGLVDDPGFWGWLNRRSRWAYPSPKAAATTTLHCALSDEVVGQSGGYFRVGRPARSSALAKDSQASAGVWTSSAGLVGWDAEL